MANDIGNVFSSRVDFLARGNAVDRGFLARARGTCPAYCIDYLERESDFDCCAVSHVYCIDCLGRESDVDHSVLLSSLLDSSRMCCIDFLGRENDVVQNILWSDLGFHAYRIVGFLGRESDIDRSVLSTVPSRDDHGSVHAAWYL